MPIPHHYHLPDRVTMFSFLTDNVSVPRKSVEVCSVVYQEKSEGGGLEFNQLWIRGILWIAENEQGRVSGRVATM